MTKVAMIWDIDLPANLGDMPGYDKMLVNCYNLSSKPTTWMIPGCAGKNIAALLLTQLKYYGDKYGGLEFGCQGMTPGQDLAALSKAEQKAIIAESERLVETMYICGRNPFEVVGFFSNHQNDDTYHAVSELDFTYNIGGGFPVDFYDGAALESGMTPMSFLTALKTKFNAGGEMAVLATLGQSVTSKPYSKPDPGTLAAAIYDFILYVRQNGGQFVSAKDY